MRLLKACCVSFLYQDNTMWSRPWWKQSLHASCMRTITLTLSFKKPIELNAIAARLWSEQISSWSALLCPLSFRLHRIWNISVIHMSMKISNLQWYLPVKLFFEKKTNKPGRWIMLLLFSFASRVKITPRCISLSSSQALENIFLAFGTKTCRSCFCLKV